MQTTLHTSLLTIGASLLLAVSISVHAQHAPYEDIFTVPGLFPSPLDTVLPSLPVLEKPEELDAAAEILWGSILGESNRNAQLSRALEGVQINLSGVLTIQGKKQLYVGIDKDTYKNYDTAHIQETLATVFPTIPIHVEPYAQIRLLQETPEKQQETLFSDDFAIKNSALPKEGKIGKPLQWHASWTADTSLQGHSVRVFQHKALTANPTAGMRVFSKTIGTSSSVFVTFSAPKIPATYYYYVCITDTCSDPVAIQVKGTRISTHSDLVDFVGCDSPIFPRHIRPMGGEVVGTRESCSTITLGGLETVDGIRGFVMAGHSVLPGAAGSKTSYTRSDHIHSIVGRVTHHSGKQVLGRVMTIPRLHVVTSGSDKEDSYITADAAFVAYPRTFLVGCVMLWLEHGESFCFDFKGASPQVERVVPLSIRGKHGGTYRVVGSREPSKHLWITGSRSGIHDDARLESERVLVGVAGSEVFAYLAMASTSRAVIPGDSGSPVYTVPDEQGTVHIVGVVFAGDLPLAGSTRRGVLFSSWEDVTATLSLKPIR